MLSPASVLMTRADVRDYRSIPTLQELAGVRSTSVAAEILHRRTDGTWPDQPELMEADGALRFDSIDFTTPLRNV